MMEKSVKNIFVAGAISPQMIMDGISKHANKTNIGAHSLFLGQIRADEIGDKTVSAIEYTANTELALVQMTTIRENIFEKYPLTCLHVYHSLGSIKVGEICFFVFVSSERRKAAIAACEELVERVKKELPIWGKEIFTDDSYQWKENKS
ncbi:molybdenum cofactor biosynthesis protein MoaE [Sphingobacterium shayense]|uniref:molybdenum cofactor biosynthesis protein MoaE n=1 Tax=Sphingobacterium shayense TaxID=626343 RepID=UPI001C131252|nr:molybdenum cofactor biosynthesis protein MoaE [Sphingobacterium shayense]